MLMDDTRSPERDNLDWEDTMKRLVTLILMTALAVSLAGVAGAQARAPRLERREWRQNVRIHRGVLRGQLARREALRLRLHQRHIRRMEWRMRRDHVLGMRERIRLHRALDRQSARIRRLRHDGRCI